MAGSALKSALRSPRYAGQDPRLIVALASLNDELPTQRHGVARGTVDHALRALEESALHNIEDFGPRELANTLHDMAKAKAQRSLQIAPQQAQRLRSLSPVSRNRARDDQLLSLSSSVPDADKDDHCGVGLQLMRRFNGDIMVMSVRTDGPAKRSGIHAGAIISAVGQTPVQGLEVEDVMDLLYGPAGSIVGVRTTEGESGAGEAGVHVLIRQHAPPQTELDLQRLVTASQRIIQASEQPWHNREHPLTSPFGGGGRVAGAGRIAAGDVSEGEQRGRAGCGREFLGNTQLFTKPRMRSFLDTSWSKKSPPQVIRRADAPERQPHTLRESLSPQPRRVPLASSSRQSRPRLLEPPPQGGGVGSLSGSVLHNGCPGAGPHVCGIGVQLVKCRNGDIVVLAVHKGGTAEKARIEKGDIIVAVDETNVFAEGLNCTQVAGLVSGHEGTLVRLFLKDKDGRDKDILVPRQTAPAVSQEILAGAAEAAAEFWNSDTGMGTGTGTGIGRGGGGGGGGGGGERKGMLSDPSAPSQQGEGGWGGGGEKKDADISHAQGDAPRTSAVRGRVGEGGKAEADEEAALPLTMYLELEEQAKKAVRDTKS